MRRAAATWLLPGVSIFAVRGEERESESGGREAQGKEISKGGIREKDGE